MAKIYIDGKAYEVNENQNLLHAIISLGFNLPYFCWHPAMGSVGACRQCAIKMFKDENDTKGRIAMACMEPVTDGARISIEDEEARAMRSNVIEWLMTNHPHDCPICDEGGECHLQDMTVMSGHNYRRFRYNKRTYRNQYLGPFINHEMNRCIQCYRCVRFYRDYADGEDLDAFAAHNHVYFGRHEDGVLENEFSGNLIEVCPTGVFTDKTLKEHYTRKWDLTTAPSICQLCSLGCNTIAGERYGTIRRVYARYNGEVNGYFICDRGRFGYAFLNSAKRIRSAKIHKDSEGQVRSSNNEDEVIKNVAGILSKGGKAIGIGSPRASLESNFALRQLVGEENFYRGVSEQDDRLTGLVLNILKNTPVRTPSLKETEKADAVFILGEDVTNTVPMLALSLRQCVRQVQKDTAAKLNIPEWHDAAVREAGQGQTNPLYIAAPAHTKLNDIARRSINLAPDDIARLGFAVAAKLDAEAPLPDNMDNALQTMAGEIADSLQKAKRPLVVSGTGMRNEAVIKAAANVARALHKQNKNSELLLTLPEANSLGLAMMGGSSVDKALKTLDSGDTDTVIILENDLQEWATSSLLETVQHKMKHVIVLDYLESRTSEAAEVTIPVAAFTEAPGTVINQEGRAQRYYQVAQTQTIIQPAWRWLKKIATASEIKTMTDWQTFDDFVNNLAEQIPDFQGVESISPPEGFRIAGQQMPRQSHRYSGRTAMKAHENVHEPRLPDDPDSPFGFSMEGYRGPTPSSLISLFWSPGWNSTQAINRFQIEVGGPLHGGDPGRRLIEPQPDRKASYFTDIPDGFKIKKSQWLVLPNYHIFGSEPKSMHTKGVAERAPRPYIMLSGADSDKFNIEKGGFAQLKIGERQLQLTVTFDETLPPGIALVPAGLIDLPLSYLPQWATISETRV